MAVSSRRTIVPALVLLPVLALAGCGGSPKDRDRTQTETAAITIANPGNDADAAGNGAQTVQVSVPGFAAKIAVPGLNLGGATQIDGVPLHPGTRLTAIRILGDAGDGTGGTSHGTVEMRYTAPAAPAAVLDYYRQAAARGGWTETPPAAGQQFAATKAGGRDREMLAIVAQPQGTGTAGRILVTGG